MDVSPGGGTVRVNQTDSPSYPVDYTFNEGSTIHLEAVPAPGFLFDRWSGDLSGTTNPATVVIDCNKRVTANFSQVVHTLTMQVSGSGSTTPKVGTHDYREGMVVSMIATPDDGWEFDIWSGDVSDPTSATTTVTIDSDKTITANFSEIMAVQVNWPLVAGIIGGLVLLASFVVLIMRRRT